MTTEPPDRYHTSRTATCEVCGWQWRQTIHPVRGGHEPVDCPMCVHRRGKAELDRVLKQNSDLKKGPTP